MSKAAFFTKFLALAVLGLALITPAQAARELPRPQLMAVYVYASWCPNCKIISPNLQAARQQGKLDKHNILFVTLDLSDKARIHQSILHAQALGIGKFLQQQGSATGYVAVLDAENKRELARFDRDTPAETMAERLASLLDAANTAK